MDCDELSNSLMSLNMWLARKKIHPQLVVAVNQRDVPLCSLFANAVMAKFHFVDPDRYPGLSNELADEIARDAYAGASVLFLFSNFDRKTGDGLVRFIESNDIILADERRPASERIGTFIFATPAVRRSGMSITSAGTRSFEEIIRGRGSRLLDEAVVYEDGPTIERDEPLFEFREFFEI